MTTESKRVLIPSTPTTLQSKAARPPGPLPGNNKNWSNEVYDLSKKDYPAVQNFIASVNIDANVLIENPIRAIDPTADISNGTGDKDQEKSPAAVRMEPTKSHEPQKNKIEGLPTTPCPSCALGRTHDFANPPPGLSIHTRDVILRDSELKTMDFESLKRVCSAATQRSKVVHRDLYIADPEDGYPGEVSGYSSNLSPFERYYIELTETSLLPWCDEYLSAFLPNGRNYTIDHIEIPDNKRAFCITSPEMPSKLNCDTIERLVRDLIPEHLHSKILVKLYKGEIQRLAGHTLGQGEENQYDPSERKMGDSIGPLNDDYGFTGTLGPSVLCEGTSYWLTNAHIFEQRSEKVQHPGGIDVVNGKLPQQMGLVKHCSAPGAMTRSTHPFWNRKPSEAPAVGIDYALIYPFAKPGPLQTRVGQWTAEGSCRHVTSWKRVPSRARVRVVGRTSGMQYGQIGLQPSTLEAGKEHRREWTIGSLPGQSSIDWQRHGIGQAGDSGAGVIDSKDNHFVGLLWGRNHVASANGGAPAVAYITDAGDLFEYIGRTHTDLGRVGFESCSCRRQVLPTTGQYSNPAAYQSCASLSTGTEVPSDPMEKPSRQITPIFPPSPLIAVPCRNPGTKEYRDSSHAASRNSIYASPRRQQTIPTLSPSTQTQPMFPMRTGQWSSHGKFQNRSSLPSSSELQRMVQQAIQGNSDVVNLPRRHGTLMLSSPIALRA